ncbi:hypothetical protein ACVWW6_008818 [Bradyrhizobium sp. USDA 3311]
MDLALDLEQLVNSRHRFQRNGRDRRRRSASTSTPASTMTRRPPASSISIRRSVECAVALSDEAATDATGPSSATTALTKPASDLVRSAAKALRQVTSRERDKPYRRAVAATSRGSDRLSKTIRAFSSSDQRRRRPVSTTSSRFSALIVWLSIRTVLNHQASPSQGVFPRRLTLRQRRKAAQRARRPPRPLISARVKSTKTTPQSWPFCCRAMRGGCTREPRRAASWTALLRDPAELLFRAALAGDLSLGFKRKVYVPQRQRPNLFFHKMAELPTSSSDELTRYPTHSKAISTTSITGHR